MNARSVALCVGMLVLGGAGVVALIPDRGQYAGLVLQDGALERAYELNTQLLLETPGTAGLLYRAYRLKRETGDVASATQAAERLVQETAHDITAVRLLAQHYLDTGAMNKRLDLLASVPPAQLHAGERAHVLASLRYAARYDEERAALERMATGGLLTPAQHGRLGMILASAGIPGRAITHLEQFDDHDETAAIYQRLTLLHLLLEANRVEDARRRSDRWHRTWIGADAVAPVANVFEAFGVVWPEQ